MEGLALALDFLKKTSSTSSSSVHSTSFISASAAATAAGSACAYIAYYPSFASQFLVSSAFSVAHADAAVSIDEAGFNSNTYSPNKFPVYEPSYKGKTYNVEVKSLFSAFEPKTLGMTTLRILLLYYLPLLEELNIEDEEEEKPPPDLILPLKQSVKHMFQEITVLTTRRLLERIVVHCASQRISWKITKDLRKSAERKAGRHMSRFSLLFCVSRTTFRGQMLGFAATWLIQVGIDLYHYFSDLKHSNEMELEILEGGEDDFMERHKSEQVLILKKRVFRATVRCTSALVFASVGAGLGAVLFRPSTGQWIGCALGEIAGPRVVDVLIKRLE
eukprot:TRINITY_DN10015_c0_g1_i1.p1 TRINITY_DN10015_c0_g1~~TRINITY_DN10015_c0_g1_i1.p1  ORF type:complete len:332 (-),score=41.04 TRINITY_DN10015_c0_g1_i1:59-1054(-)